VRAGTSRRARLSIQLWTFAEYIGFGTDAATVTRLARLHRRASTISTA